MRVLYVRTDLPVPDDFIPSKAQLDILTNWRPGYNLFSITQIADRNDLKRQHVQRKVKILRRMGLVERWPTKEFKESLKNVNSS